MGAVMPVSQDRPSEAAVARTSSVLEAGGVIVMPTDSVYGIACAAMAGNPGHARIFDIKCRPRTQTLPWLVADIGDLGQYGASVPGWARELAARFWPGALTLVVKASREVPREYREPGMDTIALRLPASPLMVAVMRRCGCPLANTSANTHGQAAAVTGHGVEGRIVDAVDLVLDAGPAPLAVASTIVDCSTSVPRILREGAIKAGELREVLS